ncbi:hypothetical protein [Methylobacterium haplocladii]|uniref:Uncharacterized protein n=1 Tax=Methylobacterium haplocladii TaxID=1176176 RepID=A0A512IV54_9HYPH|nr:hypothetical protein [Methylobacterium haplocladii]GEP01509.1 hypothetical protein MHA02_38960 [Methylobacterium haplocladii]GJD82306.1 hypothetical protein HPGCJGGD_0158 [Methylobacterium haplocladii]GLS59160.1 hypothetical protein GCM10007887_18260 [Methylobacterium haplocladii]
MHAFSFPTALSSLLSVNLTERDSLVVDGFSFISIRTLQDGVEVRSEGCGLVRFLSWDALGSLCSEERLHIEHGRAGMASAVVELADEDAGTSASVLLLEFGPPSDRSRRLN